VDPTTFSWMPGSGTDCGWEAVRTLDLFVEQFNVTNRSNFTNPSGDRRVPQTFLVPTALVGGGFPRQLQLGVRLGF
jgi:hypothetical protein